MIRKRRPEREPEEPKDLIRWDPMKELADMRRSFMDMFEDFWMHKPFTLSVPSLSKWAKGIWQPAIDIHETEKELVISASLPGLKRENIKVDIEENMITIKGERREERKVEKKNYYRREQNYGSFERNIALPDYVNPDKAKASYKDGILEIKIPKIKKPKSKGRSLDIE